MAPLCTGSSGTALGENGGPRSAYFSRIGSGFLPERLRTKQNSLWQILGLSGAKIQGEQSHFMVERLNF